MAEPALRFMSLVRNLDNAEEAEIVLATPGGRIRRVVLTHEQLRDLVKSAVPLL